MTIENFNFVTQRLKTVSKPFWNKQRTVVIIRELLSVPLQKGRRIRSNVDDHIPDTSLNTSHQLFLGIWRMLIMQSSNRATARRICQIDLSNT
ncbi:hypothetical protein OI71_07515 [Aeromonas hydrophila]|nr:hypothetical protein OI71_07515 [Aeromonas hydrophila]